MKLAPATGGSVLVVDDDAANLFVLAHALQRDHRVLAAKSGQAALEIARRQRPDLILLDVMMPGLDGFDVLDALRRDAATASIPVVFLTAVTDPESEELALQRGAVDYVTKPIRPAVVQARVQLHLLAARARRSLQEQNRWLELEVARRLEENDVIQAVSIRALAHLAEMRDTDTAVHVERTQRFVEILATGLAARPSHADQLDGQTIDLLVRSAPLHDIGKVGIPDAVLLKPGGLDPEEWAVMKTHAAMGADAIGKAEADVERSVAFLGLAKQIARSHHERWDGNGYPDGLAGEEIPLPARLMAVADVFDALISKRVYKSAMPIDEARAVITADRGTHFDPVIVDVFEERFDQFAAVARGVTTQPRGERTG